MFSLFQEDQAMRRTLSRYGFAAGMLLVGLGVSGAEASPSMASSTEATGLGATATPAAMCGFRCRYGGRYIPGPPSVCYEQGMNYCGPSGGYGGGGGRGGGGYGEGGGYGPRGGYGGGGGYGDGGRGDDNE